MGFDRKYFYVGLVISILIFGVIFFFFCNVDSEDEENYVKSVVENYIQNYCDNLSDYRYSNISEGGHCPSCSLSHGISWNIRKESSIYVVNANITIRQNHAFNYDISFKVDEEGGVIDDNLPDFHCWNPSDEILTCIELNEDWRAYIGLIESSCVADSDCIAIDPNYLPGYCGHCVNNGFNAFDDLLNFRQESIDNNCLGNDAICPSEVSCGCNSMGKCFVNLE